MSKFIDKLNRLSRGEPAPMGFTARQSAAPKPKIQIIAELSAETAAEAGSRAAGADAGLLAVTKTAGVEALQKIAKAQPDVWGVRLAGNGQNEVKQLIKAGADFIVFPAATSPITLTEAAGDAGKVLEVEPTIEEGVFRAANELPVDAVLIAGEAQALTFQQLMVFQRLADLLTKPLLVSVPPQVTAGELKALWEAGIAGAVIALSAKQPEDSLIKLRGEVDKLDFPPRNKRGSALVPRINQPQRQRREDDEDE